MLCEIDIIPVICGRLFNRSKTYLWQALEQMFKQYTFGILSCESVCLGVFKSCGAYFAFDVNSMGPPLFDHGSGVAYLIRATSLPKFMTVLILTIGSPECSEFRLNPINILKIIDIGSANSSAGKSNRERCPANNLFTKSPCPYEEEKKRKRGKRKMVPEDKKTIGKVAYKGCF